MINKFFTSITAIHLSPQTMDPNDFGDCGIHIVVLSATGISWHQHGSSFLVSKLAFSIEMLHDDNTAQTQLTYDKLIAFLLFSSY